MFFAIKLQIDALKISTRQYNAIQFKSQTGKLNVSNTMAVFIEGFLFLDLQYVDVCVVNYSCGRGLDESVYTVTDSVETGFMFGEKNKNPKM